MNVAAMDNADLDKVALRTDRRAKYAGYPYRRFDQIGLSVAKRHIIKGVFARGETSAWVAPPGGMKSALLAHAAVSIASGDEWFGRRNKERCAVAYFALERADLVMRRMEAHKARLGLPGDLPVVVIGAAVNFKDRQTIPKLLATLADIEAEYGLRVGLVVFDTFAKLVAAAGLDEDKARDQGLIFAKVQELKDKADVHVALVGHTGKDVSRGARGSNAQLGDVDLMVTLSGDVVRTATVTKANDAPEGPLFSFKSDVHEFGHDEDGDPITVNIVGAEESGSQAEPTREPKLTANQKTMFGLLHDAGASGLLTEDWNLKGREAGIGVRRRADLIDIRSALKTKGLVREMGDRWTVNH